MIDEIWRYPVKSCSGEMVDLALIGTRGVDHDRSWAVVDRETGLVASAKHPRQWGSLLMIRSMVKADGSQVSVELPDKRSGSTGDRSTLDHLLSDYLGRSVGLEPAAQIRNPTLERTDPDPEALTGSGELTLSEVTTGPLGSASPPGTVFDFAPIHVLSTATLELLDEAGGDRRRFRPNLVVDIDGPAFQENDWPGKQLLIGDEMILNVLIPSPRCVVPSLPQLGWLEASPRSEPLHHSTGSSSTTMERFPVSVPTPRSAVPAPWPSALPPPSSLDAVGSRYQSDRQAGD